MTSSAIDFIGGFFRVLSTRVSDKTRSILLELAGISDPNNPDDDRSGEVAPDQLAYGALGLLYNPLDKGTMPDERTPAQADAFGIRTADGVIPIVWFDPRIDAAFPNGPAKGTIALAGYAGGFHSIDLTDDGESNIHVIYAPLNGITPADGAAAHAIILDTTNNNQSISILHAFGHAILFTDDGYIVLRSRNGSVSVKLGNDGITLFGNTVIAGGATIGSPTGALPAAKAGPVATALTAMHTGINAALAAVTVAGGNPAVAAAYTGATGGVPAAITAIPAVNTSIF